MEKIKIIIADDHAIFRDGLKVLLNDSEEMEVVAEAQNGEELIKKVHLYEHDVVIVDLVMPVMNGIDAIKEIYLSGSKRIIAISTFDDWSFIVDAIKAGALGYVLKDARKDEFLKAVKTVNNYEKYYCTYTLSKILKVISTTDLTLQNITKQDLFSEKEKDIIRMVCEEKTSEEIAKILFMSKRTVDGFRARIVNKMNVKSLAGFAAYAIAHSLFTIEPGKPPLDRESLEK